MSRGRVRLRLRLRATDRVRVRVAAGDTVPAVARPDVEPVGRRRGAAVPG